MASEKIENFCPKIFTLLSGNLCSVVRKFLTLKKVTHTCAWHVHTMSIDTCVHPSLDIVAYMWRDVSMHVSRHMCMHTFVTGHQG